MQDWTSGSKDDLEANVEIIIATKYNYKYQQLL